MLKQDEIVYDGVPGQSAFYFDQSTLQAANRSREALWQSLQVRPHPVFGYRGQVQVYRVKRDATAETAQALAQDSAIFSKGGGTQYYMSNYKTVLEPVGTPFELGR
ncbi:MAG: hypothetical protein ACQEWL_05780 [Pseudomonadota bacterium]|uniref:hypothetical protein n=1 Tax=Providencia stuartii TaxID=588 RepID=UPI00300D23AC